jgi:hypothetical protein
VFPKTRGECVLSTRPRHPNPKEVIGIDYTPSVQKTQREKEFQRAVIEYARLMGWRVHHTRPALTQRGRWLTPVLGDVGFPDLVLCRPPRLILAELKRAGGKVSPQQREWLNALQACDGVECYVWYPNDWQQILSVLAR